ERDRQRADRGARLARAERRGEPGEDERAERPRDRREQEGEDPAVPLERPVRERVLAAHSLAHGQNGGDRNAQEPEAGRPRRVAGSTAIRLPRTRSATATAFWTDVPVPVPRLIALPEIASSRSSAMTCARARSSTWTRSRTHVPSGDSA